MYHTDNILKITYAADHIGMVATAQDVGDSETEVKADAQGEFFTTAFNWKLLHEALLACGKSTVILEQQSKAHPLKIYPESYKDNCHIIMPMHVKANTENS